jgi:hypothetical protein
MKNGSVIETTQPLSSRAPLQWSAEKRLGDINTALKNVIALVPEHIRDAVVVAAQEVYDSALEAVLPDD